MYYPNYTSSDEILRNDILARLVEDEYEEDINDSAYRMLVREYGGDINNPQIKMDYMWSCAEIFEAAIIGYIESKRDTIELSWHITDVKENAKEYFDITDNDAREILQLVKHKHDATIGVNWDVITDWTRFYLTEKGISNLPVLRSNFELVREFMMNRFDDELTPEQELSLQKFCCTHLEDSDIDGIDNDLSERGFKEWYEDNYPNGHTPAANS